MRRALLLGLLLSLLGAGPARSATGPDPVRDSGTTLTLARSFRQMLRANGVSFAATAPARDLIGPTYILPGSEGTVDPSASRLSIESEGSLVFARGHRKVILRHVSFATAPVPLVAKVGGGQLKIATSTKRRFSRVGFDSTFSAGGLRLTAKVATRLSKKLGLRDVFRKGQVLGSFRAAVEPATVAVSPTGRVALDLNPSFAAKLEANFVSTNPIAPAERQFQGTFWLPFIPAGTIAPDASAGVSRTGGSLEFLLLGSGQVFWHELWFDLGARQVLAEVDVEPTPTYPGKLGQQPILEIDATQVEVLEEPKARTVAVAGLRLLLSATGAAELNQALAGGSPTFRAGEAFGTVDFIAATR